MKIQPISREVLADKYAQGDETEDAIFHRVARALSEPEKDPEPWMGTFEQAFQKGLLGAGRIMAGAGTGAEVTLINCFVQPVGDSMEEIMRAVNQAAETMRRGGGVGYDFSAIRPKGAAVKRTGSVASGPVSYMNVFDAMCDTISSKGARRGAQMGVLRIDHPDVQEFIASKAVPWDQKPLKGFNISVAVTEPFMQALQEGASWELVHEAEPSDELKSELGAYQRDDGLWVYRVVSAEELWQQIMEATYDHADPGVLFIDRINQENNLYYCETIEATNPCGEQPLPPYACCDLGPILLPKLVHEPFTEQAKFDFDRLEELARIGVRLLDNVLDVTYWPLEEQRQEARNKRRIGLGYTGMADVLLMLGLRYDSHEGRSFAARVTRTMRDAAYLASVELAKEKGAFPLFDADRYLQSLFIQRLPEEIQAQIRKYGIRNSHLLSIAPTGTVSLAFGDNCASGIEPVFDWVGYRKVKQPDGSWKDYEVVNHAYRRYLAMTGDLRSHDEVIMDLPEHWVRAMDITAEDHLAMVAAVAPFVDSAISKTINVDTNYPYDRFEQIYLEAWKQGLKGVTTFRASEHVETVLQTRDSAEKEKPAAEQPEDLDLGDPDRRLRLDAMPTVALASLRWKNRPLTPNGNPSWTFLVDPPKDNSFAIFVGHLENGKLEPFEVWVNGAEQPRGLGALAKSLSMDMRSNDRAFLKAKLDSLAKTATENSFELTLPGNRDVVAPSTVAAFALVVRDRCEQLGTFHQDGDTPVMDALLFHKEPKTGTDGTMSWCADVNNPTTGDDFVLMLKELTLPSGSRRPYSMWLAGDYPRTLDGLCKILSWDMRVADPAWIGAKLRQLADYAELKGEFWAKVPGGDGRSRLYPSTVAYLAHLVIHRYAMLGILDADGYPIVSMGSVAFDEDAGGAQPRLRAVGSSENRQLAGARCSECGNYAVVPRDGCEFCTACGATGSCG